MPAPRAVEADEGREETPRRSRQLVRQPREVGHVVEDEKVSRRQQGDVRERAHRHSVTERTVRPPQLRPVLDVLVAAQLLAHGRPFVVEKKPKLPRVFSLVPLCLRDDALVVRRDENRRDVVFGFHRAEVGKVFAESHAVALT